MHPLLDRMATRRAEAARLDVEERRQERQAAESRASRCWGDADAGRGHVPPAPPALLGIYDTHHSN